MGHLWWSDPIWKSDTCAEMEEVPLVGTKVQKCVNVAIAVTTWWCGYDNTKYWLKAWDIPCNGPKRVFLYFYIVRNIVSFFETKSLDIPCNGPKCVFFTMVETKHLQMHTLATISDPLFTYTDPMDICMLLIQWLQSLGLNVETIQEWIFKILLSKLFPKPHY